MSIIVFKSNNPNYNALEINTNPVLPNEPIIASGYTGMPIRYGRSYLWKEGDNYSYGLDKKDRAAPREKRTHLRQITDIGTFHNISLKPVIVRQ